MKQNFKNDIDTNFEKKFDFEALNQKYGFNTNLENDKNIGFNKTVPKMKNKEFEDMDFSGNNNPPRVIKPIKYKKPENPNNIDDVFN